MVVMNPQHHAQACQEITQLVLWSWLIGKRRCWIFLRFQLSVTSYVRSHIKRIEPSRVFSFHMHGSCSTSSKSLIEMQLSHIFILFAEPHCEHRDIPPSLSLSVTHTPVRTLARPCSARVEANARLSLWDPNSPKLHAADGKQPQQLPSRRVLGAVSLTP